MITTHITVQHGTDSEIRKEVENFVDLLAFEIPTASRQLMDESTPAGRIYRRGMMTGRRSKALLSMGLKPIGKTRIQTGAKFHRASAPGQVPAKDSGDLYRKIRISGRKGNRTITFDTPYAGYVEEQRPFLDAAIERAIENVTR